MRAKALFHAGTLLLLVSCSPKSGSDSSSAVLALTGGGNSGGSTSSSETTASQQVDNDPNLICTATDAQKAPGTPPLIWKSNPVSENLNMPIGSPITIYFNEPVDCSTTPHITFGSPTFIRNRNITKIDNYTSVMMVSESGQVARYASGTVYHNDAVYPGYYARGGFFVTMDVSCKCNRLQLKPIMPLVPDTNYWIVLSNEIRDLAGNHFSGLDLTPIENFYIQQNASQSGPWGLTNADIQLAENLGGLIHFATSSDCAYTDSPNDPAFASVPLSLCSVRPRALRNVSGTETFVATFNKPLDCTDPYAPWNGGVFGTSFYSDYRQQDGTPIGVTTNSNCSGRELRITADPAIVPGNGRMIYMSNGFVDSQKTSTWMPWSPNPQIQFNGHWYTKTAMPHSYQYMWGGGWTGGDDPGGNPNH